MGNEIHSTKDVVDFLLEQHEEIKRLFTQTLQAKTSEDRKQSFFELRRLLAVHETAEEEIVHPLARSKVGNEVVDARLSEENKAKQQLADLESADPDDADFQQKLEKLQKDVLAHAEHEEQEEFAQLKRELGAEELEKFRETVRIAEKLAPTRPHPGVEGAAANILAGPFAMMLDRARDFFRKPSD